MKSANAPFNEFGQSMILRDIEDLYIDVAGLNEADRAFAVQMSIVSNAINTIGGTLAGLGTMATQNANAVAITGGTLASVAISSSSATGLTIVSSAINSLTAPLSVLYGGTGKTGIAVDRFLYGSSTDNYSETTITSFGRLFVACVDAAAGRTQLALGTIATQNANNVTITGGSITALSTLTTPDTATLQLLGTASVYIGTDSSLTRLNFSSTTACSLTAGDSTSRGRLSQGTNGSLLTYTTSGGGDVTSLNLSSTTCALAAGPVSMVLTANSGQTISATVGSGASLTLTTGAVVTTNSAIFYYQATTPDFRIANLGASSTYGKWGQTLLVVGAATATTNTISLHSSGSSHLEIDGSQVLAATTLKFSGTQVVTTRQSAVTAPSGGATVDSQARTAINDIISRLQSHGLIS